MSTWYERRQRADQLHDIISELWAHANSIKAYGAVPSDADEIHRLLLNLTDALQTDLELATHELWWSLSLSAPDIEARRAEMVQWLAELGIDITETTEDGSSMRGVIIRPTA